MTPDPFDSIMSQKWPTVRSAEYSLCSIPVAGETAVWSLCTHRATTVILPSPLRAD
jgi:hypothetical protein